MPRQTAWMVQPGCTCPYKYGGVTVAPQVFPQWMPEAMRVVMPKCGISDESEWPNCCNLNLYNDGSESVGWHADDEPLFQGKHRRARIISLSLGATRAFEIRDNQEHAKTFSLMLKDGDLLSMDGLTQKHYLHQVPKCPKAEPRINLTWRWIVCHAAGCRCMSSTASAQAAVVADAPDPSNAS